jgi:plasmid replication initiation protein
MSDLTERNYIRQSHIINNAKYSLTRGEIDLVLTLLTAITKRDRAFKEYEFTLSELELKTSRVWNSKQLQANLESLMAKPLKIQLSDDRWKLIPWFSYFEYNNGAITCRFDKALKPYLLELKERFVISDLRMLLPMRSSYSKRIYMLLKEYEKIGERTFRVSALQELLKSPKSHSDRYNKFKSAVLEQAVKDINKHTDLEVNFTEIKLGRKVNKVKYTIVKNMVSLKEFIATIREIYPNQRLLFYNDKPLKCSNKGLLYYANDSLATLTKSEALKAWNYLHENINKLEIFQKGLF